MPTIFEIGLIKIQIYARDHNPPHAHAIIGDGAEYEARINLKTGEVLSNVGFRSKDLKVLVARVMNRRDDFLKAWSEFNGE